MTRIFSTVRRARYKGKQQLWFVSTAVYSGTGKFLEAAHTIRPTWRAAMESAHKTRVEFHWKYDVFVNAHSPD